MEGVEDRTRESVMAEVIAVLNEIDALAAEMKSTVRAARESIAARKKSLAALRDELKNGIQPRLAVGPMKPRRSPHKKKED